MASLHGTWPGIFAQVHGKGLRFDSLHLHVDQWMLHATLPQLDDTKDTKDVWINSIENNGGRMDRLSQRSIVYSWSVWLPWLNVLYITLNCIILYLILCYIILYYIILYSIISYYIILYYIILDHIILYIIVYYIILYYIILYYIVLYYTMLYYIIYYVYMVTPGVEIARLSWFFLILSPSRLNPFWFPW